MPKKDPQPTRPPDPPDSQDLVQNSPEDRGTAGRPEPPPSVDIDRYDRRSSK
ncbi:MAG: hypothetical protein JNM43_07570 [Planctomycetaceae bacterium]|nr:hypothetical protein [Planctomycetaceae bacterium]